MGTKIEQVREQWGHVLVVRDAIAEHDAEIAALTARAERAEAALANLRADFEGLESDAAAVVVEHEDDRAGAPHMVARAVKRLRDNGRPGWWSRAKFERVDWKARAEKAEADLTACRAERTEIVASFAAARDKAESERDVAREKLVDALAALHAEQERRINDRTVPAPADMDGWVRVYVDARDDSHECVAAAGVAAVLAAFARAVETDAAVGAAMDATGGTRAALRAAVEAALGAKVEPAYVEPAPLPPLPEVPEWMRRERADAADGSVAALLVDLVDALRARGGR